MNNQILLSAIDIAASPQLRVDIRPDVVEEYAAQYRQQNHTMPPPILFQTGEVYLIADGMHRVTAMKKAGLEAHTFDIRSGTRQDCIKCALQSNLHHGVRRTNADKRQCAITALKEFPNLSNSQIAEIAAVGDDLVAQIRRELETNSTIAPVSKRTGADGKNYSIRKTNPAATVIDESKLTPAEEAKLKRIEEVITKFIPQLTEHDKALAEIRDRRLYREEYDTFEEYSAKNDYYFYFERFEHAES